MDNGVSVSEQRPSKLRDAGLTKLADKLDQWAEKNSGPEVVVKTVKGDHAAERTIKQMLGLGYELDAHNTPVTGRGTRKQKHTLTFTRRKAGPDG